MSAHLHAIGIMYTQLIDITWIQSLRHNYSPKDRPTAHPTKL